MNHIDLIGHLIRFRGNVAKCNLNALITDSKFLPEHILLAFMQSIARTTEYYTLSESSSDSQLLVDFENLPPVGALLSEDLPTCPVPKRGTLFGDYLADSLAIDALRKSISTSSLAWLEVVLVEIALRNRDRFHVCWPTLRAHYLRSLGSQSFKLSYVAERYSADSNVLFVF